MTHVFFFNDTATTEIYTLSLHDALPISVYLSLAISHFDAGVGDDVGMLGISARVFAITVIPVAIGMWIRARRDAWAVAKEPIAKRIAMVAFVVVVVGAVAEEWGTVTDHFAELAV